MTRLWSTLLIIAVVGSTISPTQAIADTQPKVDPCNASARSHKHTWLDATHQQMSQFLCFPSRWLDHFFHDDTPYRWQQAGTTVRLTQTATWRDDHQSSTPFDIHARAELPGLEQRFKLFFVNDDDVLEAEHKQTDSQSGEDDNQTKGFRAAFRFAWRQTQRYGVDLDVGLRSGIHAYSQIRYRWRHSLFKSNNVAFEQKFYYLDPEGTGSNTLIQFSRQLSSNSNLRFSTNVLYSEENHQEGNGWVLSENIAYYYRLDDKSAIKLRLGTYAYTKPSWAAQKYHFSILYRRNFFRSWLFYEVEPFWEWPHNQQFGTVTGISLRLEAVFGFYNH